MKRMKTTPNFHTFQNRYYSGLTIRAEVPASQSQKDDSPPVTPDSTTEPPPRPPSLFQEGDDVFFHTKDDQCVLGTVGQIAGQTCQVLFGDGTQQWTGFKNITKLACDLSEDETSTAQAPIIPTPKKDSSTKKDAKAGKSPRSTQSVEVPCASCGVQRRISQSKARQFGGTSNNLFKCRRCNNRSKSSSNSNICMDTTPLRGGQVESSRSQHSSGHHSRSPPDVFIKASNRESPQQSNFPFDSVKGRSPASPNRLNSNKTVPSQSQIIQTDAKYPCFHCEQGTKWYNRVQCNLCDRPCHLTCLALTPPPLNGDNKFWDLMCSTCGTQNGCKTEKERVFSVRRNISSWSDIIHLVISCKTVESEGQTVFDLYTEILPFIVSQLSRLHLPSKFKQIPLDERKKLIETALTNSKLRFINGRELGGMYKETEWAVRTEQNSRPIQINCDYGRGKKPNQVSTTNQILQKNPDGSPTKLKRKYTRKDMSGLLDDLPKKPQVVAFRNGIRVPSPTRNKVVAKRACEGPRSNQAIFLSSAKPLITPLSKTSFSEIKKVKGSESKPLRVSGSSSDSGSESNSSSTGSDITSSSTSIDTSNDSKTSAAEPPSKPKRGRPKGQGIKRLLSPSSSKKVNSSIRHGPFSPGRNQLQIHPPIHKKLRKESCSPLRKETTPIPSAVISRLTPSPIRPVQKIASPPRIIQLQSESKIKLLPIPSSSTDTSSSDGSEVGAESPQKILPKVLDVPSTLRKLCGTPLPTAIKSASVHPVPSPQLQVLIRNEPLKTLSAVSATATVGRRGRPKLNRRLATQPFKPGLRLRPRGRPLIPKTLIPPKVVNTNFEGTGILKPPGLSSLQKRPVPTVTSGKRVIGPFERKKSFDYERSKPKPLPQSERDLDVCPPNGLSNLLFDAALYGDYKMQCLPTPPRTEVEKRKEARQVFDHYRAEKEDQLATLLLGRSETETRSQSRRKSELFGMQKRDLTDFDSYEVLGKRVDPDGSTRYFIAWKIPGLDDESESDDEYVMENREASASSSPIGEKGKEIPNVNSDEEDPEILVEVGRSGTVYFPNDIIDLTDSP